MEKLKELANELIDFLYESPTSYHAVLNTKKELLENGFKELKSQDKWNLEKNGQYFVTSGNTALMAFRVGGNLAENGFRIIGAHNDSPTFKIKPVSELSVKNTYVKLNTETYGGPIYSTWFDRPLSLAGKVVVKNGDIFSPDEHIININKPIMIIPNLAIHFNREINDGYKYNPQVDTNPLLTIINSEMEKDGYLINLIANELNVKKEDILNFELFLYEYSKGCIMGLHDEFISSSRLDDLWMVHAGLKAMINASENKSTQILMCMDHEEIGSQTAQGADSMMVLNTLKRINLSLGGDEEDFYRALSKSIAISADLAHAIHPNHPDKHDPENYSVLGKGPVLKYSAKQKYITTAYSASVFMGCCESADVPYQKHTNRSDVVGGGTIAKFLASILCIDVVDMGTPVLAMHSVRELGAVVDNDYVQKAFKAFYSAK